MIAPLLLLAGRAGHAQEEQRELKEQVRGVQEVMNVAKSIGPWESQFQIIDEATDNVFRQQGWNSEPDLFARDVLRQVGVIAPWRPREREEVFLNAVQSRFSLTHDQRTSLAADMRREAMAMTIKHFKDALPVVLDMASTRARNQAFTPEQVQEWSRRLKPMMDEGAQMMERVADRLKRTMTEEQRRRLDEDMRAFQRRHKDVRRMVERWEDGKWTPADWGLQNDPLHAVAAARHSAIEAQKNALVEQARLASNPDEPRISVNESSWDRYVKWFCSTYQCDARQRSMSDSILRGSKKEAMDYRAARRDVIERYEALAASSESSGQRENAEAELARLLAPISQVFERMKLRLYQEVLTTEQRKKFTPRPPPAPPPIQAEAPEAPPPT